MAFATLPERLRCFAIRQQNGRIARFEFSVFAGEVVGEEDDMDDERAAARMSIASARDAEPFSFEHPPIRHDAGEVIAALGLLPVGVDRGPLLSVANLDADVRVDFRWREREALRHLTGDDFDARGWTPFIRMALKGTVIAALVGGLAFAAAILAGDGAAQSAAEGHVIAKALAAASAQPEPIALIFGLAAWAHQLAKAGFNARRMARAHERLLGFLWRRVGAALGHVQDEASQYRLRPRRLSQSSLLRGTPFDPTVDDRARRPAARAPRSRFTDDLVAQLRHRARRGDAAR